MGVLQASCSDLVVEVPGGRAAELLERALELAREMGSRFYVYAEEDFDIVTRDVDPGGAELVVRRAGGRVREAYYTHPAVELEEDPRLYARYPYPEDRGSQAMIEFAWEKGYALYVNQHHQPQYYPLLAQLSYEFGARVLPYDGGDLWDFVFWLEYFGIRHEKGPEYLGTAREALAVRGTFEWARVLEPVPERLFDVESWYEKYLEEVVKVWREITETRG